MPISYSFPDNSDFLNTLSTVNKASPKPNYDATDLIKKAGSSGSLYGMNPQEIGSNFDSAFQSAQAGYAPFPGDHSKIDQLQALYGTVPQAFDVSGTLSSLDKARGTSLLTGQQASNNAATKFRESQQPGQYSNAGSEVLRAQSLLPYLQQDTQATADEGKYADTAKQNALSAASGIAQSLAQLQQQYTDSLASYNSQKANFGLNFAGQKTGMQLTASTANTQNHLELLKSMAQIAENARQANLNAALTQRSQNIGAAETATNQQMQASQALLSQPTPGGNWVTDMSGNVVSGQQQYNAYQDYLQRKNSALGTLGKIA
jgi:hypothetical protein